MPPLKRNTKHTKIKGKTSRNAAQPQPTIQNATITSFFSKQNSSVKCPCCARIIPKHDINIHLDVCCNTSDVVEITIDSESEEKVAKEAKMSPQKRKSSSSGVGESPKRAKIGDENEGNVAEFQQKRAYYLDNFVLVVNAVIGHPDDSCLFDREDRNVFDEYFKLSVDAQKLYVRMFQRKLKWYQVVKLDYPEIKDDLNGIVDELIGKKFFVNGHDSIDTSSILHIMQLNDLKSLLKKLNLTQHLNSNKPTIINTILKHGKQQKTLFVKSMDQVILKEATKIFGKCFKMDERVRRIFVRVFLLFSLTSYIPNDDHKQQQQVFTLHLVNTNQLVFPDYSVLRSVRVFRSRDDLIRYEEMYEIELDLMSAIEKGNWDRGFEIYTSCKELVSSCDRLMDNDGLHAHVSTLPTFLQRYSAGATLIRCLTIGVEILERLRKYEAAVNQLHQLIAQTDYHLDYRGRWSERLALNLEQHLKQPHKALNTIIEALNDPRIRGGHKLALHQRATRICSSAKNVKLKTKLNTIPKFDVRQIPKVVIEGRIVPSSSTSGCKTTFMTPIGDSSDVLMSSVEDFAIGHYKSVGFDQGVHGESSTFTSLFCLLFWDVIYMSGIPDVFRSPHQIAPLDLNGECFYRQRRGDIDERLEWLRNADSAEISDQLATSWAMHFGMTSLVNWGLFSSFQHLESLSECIEGAILSKICERLAKDYRFTRSGFPDLVVWSTKEKKFKIVEVKGPNDRLSTKQTLWLDFLLTIGASAEVCHVTATATKKLKKLNKTP